MQPEAMRLVARARSGDWVPGDMSESAVEKHIGSIFLKLDLTPEPETHRRVAAVLTFLRCLRDG